LQLKWMNCCEDINVRHIDASILIDRMVWQIWSFGSCFKIFCYRSSISWTFQMRKLLNYSITLTRPTCAIYMSRSSEYDIWCQLKNITEYKAFNIMKRLSIMNSIYDKKSLLILLTTISLERPIRLNWNF
jgi:hypothetical protein